MNKQDYFYLGTIVSKFSFKGELLIKIDSDEIDFKKIKTIFLETEGTLVPFSIQNVRFHKSSLLRIKLDIVDNEDKANQLLKSKVYLPMKDLPPLEENKFYFHEVIDFNVIDQAIGDLGNIFEINDQTSQPILIVKKNDKKIMIPLVDEFIVELNKKEKKIIFNLPEGLTEL